MIKYIDIRYPCQAKTLAPVEDENTFGITGSFPYLSKQGIDRQAAWQYHMIIKTPGTIDFFGGVVIIRHSRIFQSGIYGLFHLF